MIIKTNYFLGEDLSGGCVDCACPPSTSLVAFETMVAADSRIPLKSGMLRPTRLAVRVSRSSAVMSLTGQ